MGDIEASLLTNSNEFPGEMSEDEFDELSVYEQLYFIFIKLVNSLEDNDTSDICESVKQFLNNTIIRFRSEKVKIFELKVKQLTPGHMIS